MKFSIITVALNAEKLIGETLQSVLDQTYTDYEIVVKDGLSTDGTLSMIPEDPRIRVISCEDHGIYQAMNQGIQAAEGEYLLFLNCGDLLYDTTVLERVAAVLPVETPAIVYGDYMKGNVRVSFADTVTKMHFYESTLCHQASYFSRDVFEKVGLYDETFRIASDWKCFLDSKIYGVNFVHLAYPLCTFLDGGVSETEKGLRIAKEEREKTIAQRFSKKERVLHFVLASAAGQWLMKIRRKVLNRIR